MGLAVLAALLLRPHSGAQLQDAAFLSSDVGVDPRAHPAVTLAFPVSKRFTPVTVKLPLSLGLKFPEREMMLQTFS